MKIAKFVFTRTLWKLTVDKYCPRQILISATNAYAWTKPFFFLNNCTIRAIRLNVRYRIKYRTEFPGKKIGILWGVFFFSSWSTFLFDFTVSLYYTPMVLRCVCIYIKIKCIIMFRGTSPYLEYCEITRGYLPIFIFHKNVLRKKCEKLQWIRDELLKLPRCTGVYIQWRIPEFYWHSI